MEGVEILKRTYPHLPPPQTQAELEDQLVGGFPTYRPDPKTPGKVIITKGWLDDNMTVEWIPLMGQRYLNRLMVIPLFLVMSEIAASPYYDYIKPRQCGIWMPRHIGWDPLRSLSFHALGLGNDINWNENGYGRTDTSIRRNMWIVEAFEKHGFTWGGWWSTPDDMHFQYGHKLISIPKRRV